MSTREQSPEEIEHEIAATRAELSGTLDAIQRRFSPGRMLQDAFGAARGAAGGAFGAAKGAAEGAAEVGTGLKDAGGDFAVNLGRTLRDNPVPVALLGIGLGWLAFVGRHRDDHTGNGGYRPALPTTLSGEVGPSDIRDFGGPARGRSGDGELPTGIGAATEAVGERAGAAAESLEERAERVRGTVEEIGSGVRAHAAGLGEQASGSAHRARQAAGDAANAAGGYARRAGYAASDYAGRASHLVGRAGSAAGDYAARTGRSAAAAGRGAVHFAEEHPMVAAAGLAVAGAAFAALLPRSRREDKLMGESADAMKRSVRQTAQQAVREAKEIARTAAEAAKGTAGREDLTPEAAKRGIGHVADAAADVVHAAGETARSETGRRLAPEQESDSGSRGGGSGRKGAAGS